MDPAAISVEPRSVEFQDVLPGVAYSAALQVRNGSVCRADLALSSTSGRYQLSATRLALAPGQTQVVTLQLLASSFPHARFAASDWVVVRSATSGLTLRVPVRVQAHWEDPKEASSLSTIRAVAPSARVRSSSAARAKDKAPAVSASDCPRCEERSEKIMHILSAKDAEIAMLRRKLQSATQSDSVEEYAERVAGESRAALERERGEHAETLATLEALQDEHELLRRQHEALREKMLDQHEYIEAKLRTDASEKPPPSDRQTQTPPESSVPRVSAAPASEPVTDELLQFYLDRACAAEEVSEVLRGRVDEMLFAQDAALASVARLEARVEEGAAAARSLRSSLDARERELSAALARCEEQEQTARALSERLESRSLAEGAAGGEAWWVHVWRECGRSAGDSSLPREAEQVVVLAQRQLSQQLRWEAERVALLERAGGAEREAMQLRRKLRDRQSAEALVVAELTETVRALSGQNELFSKLAASRQDLTNAKLRAMQLEVDAEAYRDAIASLRAELADAKKGLDDARFSLGQSLVYDSVAALPGVSPLFVIEAFAGKLTQMEEQLAFFRAESASKGKSASSQLSGLPSSTIESSERMTQLQFTTQLHLLRCRVSDLEEELRASHSQGTPDFEEVDRLRQDLGASERRAELLESDLEDAQTESADLRQRLVRLQEQLVLIEIDAKTPALPLCAASSALVAAPPASDGESLSALTSQLQSKTREIHSLKEALAVVQRAVAEEKENRPNGGAAASRREAHSAYNPTSVLALANHVAGLTEELAHVRTCRDLAETRLASAERDLAARSKELLSVHSQLRSTSQQFNEQRTVLASSSEHLKEALRLHASERSGWESERDALAKALRQQERKAGAQEVLVDQLSFQLGQSLDSELVRLVNATSADRETDPAASSVPDAIRTVFGLLERAAESGVSEDLKRGLLECVCAMESVFHSHERARLSLEVSSEKMERALKYANIYKKRSEGLARVVAAKEKNASAASSSLVSFWRGTSQSLSQRLSALAARYLDTRERLHCEECRGEMARALESQLLVRVRELEGQAKVASKEESLQGLLEHVKGVENSMQSWVKEQLPSLLTSLVHVEGGGKVEFDPVNGKMTVASGSDNIAHVSHALACSKVQLSQAYLQIAVLAESKSLLEDKCNALSAAVDDLTSSAEAAASTVAKRVANSHDSFVEEIRYERWAAADLPQLDERILGLQEEVAKRKQDAKGLELKCAQLEKYLVELQHERSVMCEDFLSRMASLKLQCEIRLSAAHRGLQPQTDLQDDSPGPRLVAPELLPRTPDGFALADSFDNARSFEALSDSFKTKFAEYTEKKLDANMSFQDARESFTSGLAKEYRSNGVGPAARESVREIVSLLEEILNQSDRGHAAKALVLSAYRLSRQLLKALALAGPLVQSYAAASTPDKNFAHANVATSPLSVSSEPAESTQHADAIASDVIVELRRQMASLENIVTVKDGMDEEFAILEEQKALVQEHNLKAAALVEELRGERADMEYVVESLRKSYEESLANSSAALESHCVASNKQVRKLEELLVKQQTLLASFGVQHESVFRIRRSRQPKGQAPGESPALKNRRLAYREDVGGAVANARSIQSAKRKLEFEPYLTELEDEVLGLRIYLASEKQVRSMLETENSHLRERLVAFEKEFADTAEDESSFPAYVSKTSDLSLEEQNSLLGKVSSKLAMIALLNSMRRNAETDLRQAQESLKDQGKASAQSKECMSLQASVSALQAKVFNLKDEIVRKDKLLMLLKEKHLTGEAERVRLRETLLVSENKIERMDRDAANKAALIVHLKRKYEGAVEEIEEKSDLVPAAAELHRRAEAVEKKRLQEVCKGLRLKLGHAVEDATRLQAEVDRLSAYESRLEQLVASNQRKELTSKSYKDVADRASIALADLKKEFEIQQSEFSKEKKNLQRRIDIEVSKARHKEGVVQGLLSTSKELEQKIQQVSSRVSELQEENKSLREELKSKRKTSPVKVKQQAAEEPSAGSPAKEQSFVIFDASNIPIELASSLEDLSDVFAALNSGAVAEAMTSTGRSLLQSKVPRRPPAESLEESPSTEKSAALKSLVRAVLATPTK